MKSHGSSSRHHTILSYINVLPRHVLALHGVEQSAAYVLHELCRARCFNLVKAAYFVDNPDFDRLHGIAGYSTNDHKYDHTSNHHQAYDELMQHLNECTFNREVRSIECSSHTRARKSKEEILAQLADKLQMKNAGCYVWPLKYDNHGVLIYQMADDLDDTLQDCLYNSLHLLGFCPIVPER